MSKETKPKAQVFKGGYGSHQHPAIFFRPVEKGSMKVEYILTYDATADELFEMINRWAVDYDLEFSREQPDKKQEK